jgi:hypothetical protein
MAPRFLSGQHVYLMRPDGPVLAAFPFLGRCGHRPHVGPVRGSGVRAVNGHGLEPCGLELVIALPCGLFSR